MIICKDCNEEKDENNYDLNGKYRRKYCKECRRKKNRTGRKSTTIFKKGQVPWNKGKPGKPAWNKGKTLSKEYRKKLSDAHKGKKLSEEHRKSLSAAQLKRWEQTEREDNRYLVKHKKWRSSVLKRDENKCTECKGTKRIAAHHIVPWKEDESLRFDVDNGKTLCCHCHAKLEGFQEGQEAWNAGIKCPGNVNSGSFKKGQIPWNKGLKKVV